MPRTTILSLGCLRGAAQNESCDNDIITGADKGAGAEVRQFRVSVLIEVVNFHQGDTSAAAITANDRGVGPGRQGGVDSRFEIVGRAEYL